MAYNNFLEDVPGIQSLFTFRPETGKYLYDVALVSLNGESPLTHSKRKFIAAYVYYLHNYIFSSKNQESKFTNDEKSAIVDKVLKDMNQANVSDKMKALLHIVFKVQISGKEVKEEDIAEARKYGADDRTIHDTMLIAVTFNMLNRYVKALASLKPNDANNR
jgi:hypothetical protein